MEQWTWSKYEVGCLVPNFGTHVTWDPLVAKDEIDGWGDKPWTCNSICYKKNGNKKSTPNMQMIRILSQPLIQILQEGLRQRRWQMLCHL